MPHPRRGQDLQVHQPRIDPHPVHGRVVGAPVGDAAAGDTAMKLDRPVIPLINLRRPTLDPPNLQDRELDPLRGELLARPRGRHTMRVDPAPSEPVGEGREGGRGAATRPLARMT